jgi:hypothetical protein
MSHKNTVLMRELVAWAMVRGPGFNPDEGDTQDSVFLELRERLANMKTEWWGGDELYQQMVDHVDNAEASLNANDWSEALGLLGKIYGIIDQTPRLKNKVK